MEGTDAILQAAQAAHLEDLSRLEVDGDGSSSLSDIEDKDGDQEDDVEGSDELSEVSDENDSEAETERLEESPNKFQAHQDVVLSSRNNDNHIYEASPSKLHNQIVPDDQDEDDDDDPLSSDDISVNDTPESPKSAANDDAEHTTAPTSLDDSSGESKMMLSVAEADTRKRKRSIMAGSSLDEDMGEPLRKRTGSVMTPGDEYAIEDGIIEDEEEHVVNNIIRDISEDEVGVVREEDPAVEAEDPMAPEEAVSKIAETPTSPKKRGRKKKKASENGVRNPDVDSDAVLDAEIALNGDNEGRHGEEDHADNEGDEVDAITKSEEELERKRIAHDTLSEIESQFLLFREKYHDERLEELNREEAMLKAPNPTHPIFLAQAQALRDRRDNTVRVARKQLELEMQSLCTQAVAKRSQILSQYQQEIRDVREKQLEELGEQWYKIQHDRRSYAGSVPDYSLKFPKERSQQLRNHSAYVNEVSLLSGVAKYVGFPAAPPMASATDAELDEDLQLMGRTKHIHRQSSNSLPLQELAALRAASSASRFRPAEEQFIEQTPWANPQHPAHAHLLQRQASAQQTPRTISPFSQVQMQPRRHSHQQGSGIPVSGTFSNTSLLHHTNGLLAGGRASPLGAFRKPNHNAPSP